MTPSPPYTNRLKTSEMRIREKEQLAADLQRAMRLSITYKFVRAEKAHKIIQVNLQRRKDGQRLTGSFQMITYGDLPAAYEVLSELANCIEIEQSMNEYVVNHAIHITDGETFQSAQKAYTKARKVALIVQKIFFDVLPQLAKFKPEN